MLCDGSETDVSDIQADLVVIGFGKGGKTLALTLGRQGKRVVMIERSNQMYGGTCINIGCVPTKSMVFAAEEALSHPRDPEMYTAAVHRTAELTASLREQNYAMLDSIPGVDVLTGTATFLDAHTVSVQTDDGVVTVEGHHIVVGTGSEPVRPNIPGLPGNPRAMTSAELLATDQLPSRLVVLGGGYVGLEFAAMCAAYGAHVTLLERQPSVLSREDDDVAAVAVKLLEEAGVRIVCAADVTSIDESTVHYRVGARETSVEADGILVALGRRPVTSGLNLEAASIAIRDDGTIAVDEHLRTSQPHIFAVGDVNGGPRIHLRIARRLPSCTGSTQRQRVPNHLRSCRRALHALHDTPVGASGTYRTASPRSGQRHQGRGAAGGQDGDRAAGAHRAPTCRPHEGGRRRRHRRDPRRGAPVL